MSSLKYDDTIPTTISYNGNEVKTVWFNDVLVWSLNCDWQCDDCDCTDGCDCDCGDGCDCGDCDCDCDCD